MPKLPFFTVVIKCIIIGVGTCVPSLNYVRANSLVARDTPDRVRASRKAYPAGFSRAGQDE